MRHGKKFNHLGRTAPHRKAMLSNMACSLFLHKRISTTVAKAKELRKYVEPFITRAKEDTTHNRRVVFSYLQNKDAIKILFGEVVEKVGSRPGGYTRIIKTGFRLGDNAEMSIIELVDYNELMLKDAKPAKKSTRRRSRRGAGAAASTDATPTAEVVEEPTDKASKAAKPSAEEVEAPKEETSKTDQPSAEGEDQTDAKDEKKAE
ncbi:MAG TPA: 50S ribosomal protein L17 [Lunatimonas sp.]|nr:50S ribosomal protein L17 [Lunatimonas sp.]